MTSPADVDLLTTWMSGYFSNAEQAIENPPFFAHIRVSIRCFYHDSFPAVGRWLYLEQAYDYKLNDPYRTAVVHLFFQDDCIVFDNYRPQEVAAYVGASRNPALLAPLTFAGVEKLTGCSIRVDRTPQGTFAGKIEPGKQCLVWRNGRESYLQNEFEISEFHYSSLDRGLDPQTDERVWGSIAGPFEFVKTESYPLP